MAAAAFQQASHLVLAALQQRAPAAQELLGQQVRLLTHRQQQQTQANRQANLRLSQQLQQGHCLAVSAAQRAATALDRPASAIAAPAAALQAAGRAPWGWCRAGPAVSHSSFAYLVAEVLQAAAAGRESLLLLLLQTLQLLQLMANQTKARRALQEPQRTRQMGSQAAAAAGHRADPAATTSRC